MRRVGTLDGSSALPGQHLTDLILRQFCHLLRRRSRVQVTLYWVPSRTGMGNGAVNVQVKLPARGRPIGDSNSSSCRAASQVFPWSVSAVGQYTLQTLRKEAVLTSTPQRSRARQVSPSLPTMYLKAVASLLHRSVTILTQLRTGQPPCRPTCKVDSPDCVIPKARRIYNF